MSSILSTSDATLLQRVALRVSTRPGQSFKVRETPEPIQPPDLPKTSDLIAAAA